jgi:hypothetical protein
MSSELANIVEIAREEEAMFWANAAIARQP